LYIIISPPRRPFLDPTLQINPTKAILKMKTKGKKEVPHHTGRFENMLRPLMNNGPMMGHDSTTFSMPISVAMKWESSA